MSDSAHSGTFPGTASPLFLSPGGKSLRDTGPEAGAFAASEADPLFEDIARLAAQACGTSMATVSLSDGERRWFEGRVGAGWATDPLDTDLYRYVDHTAAGPVVSEDTSQDARFNGDPVVTNALPVRFFAGIPVIGPDGRPQGAVCVFDTVSRPLTPAQSEALLALGRQTAALVALRKMAGLHDARVMSLKSKVAAAFAEDGQHLATPLLPQRPGESRPRAGGIAHDFNNLLQTLNVSLQLIHRKADQPDQVTRWAAGGLDAVARGAKLTAHLLAISREDSPQRARLAITPQLEGMRTLLERTLGPEVVLELDLDDAHACVTVDPMQFEAAMLHLAINATDAMAGIGCVRIQSRRVDVIHDRELADGEYVQISMDDDGPGMDAATQDQAFEPFFTTKLDGMRSGLKRGLGLAQVYGFANAAAGTARILPPRSRGTTIAFWLRTLAAEAVESPGTEPVESMGDVAAMEPVTAPGGVGGIADAVADVADATAVPPAETPVVASTGPAAASGSAAAHKAPEP